MSDGEVRAARPSISVVVPAYGCVGTLRPLHERLTAVLEGLVASHEIIFVDDRGPQDQEPVLREIAAADPRVRIVRMARNFGQQIAITAGLAESGGDFVVVMDCDLQDPPEFIPDLWRAAQKGFDIVYASRRNGDPASRQLLNRLYFRVMSAATGYKVDPGQGSFSMISRQVVSAYLHFRERERHYLFILRWLGFDSVTLVYERHERTIGRSSYTLRSLIRHSIQGFFFQSTAPLTWTLKLGLATAGVGVAASLVLLGAALAGQGPGVGGVLVAMHLVTSGVILSAVGSAGLYIARIFEEVKGRPLYVVNRREPPPNL